MNKKNRSIPLEYVLSILIFSLLCVFNHNSSSTGDAGDSIMHYLYSKYSFHYPEFFFHHWAKPFFVLLSAPFTLLGFKGIVLFNSLCASLIGLFTFKTAVLLKQNHPWLVFVFVFFAPLFFALIFSGLTEYLFALFFILGIYFMAKEKVIVALIFISFLPLIRSEGLIILVVFGFYLLWTKQLKMAFLLLTGQILYSIAGAFLYKDLLWLIHEIPYTNLKARYGSGELLDFVHRLNYVIEKPIYLFLAIGCILAVWKFIQNSISNENRLFFLLIFGSFAGVFIAHSIFWWKGIFNSMGLPRVLLAVHPAIALLALLGLNELLSSVKNKKMYSFTLVLVVTLIVVFPFTKRPQGVVFNESIFRTNTTEIIKKDLAPFLNQAFPNWRHHRLFYTHPALSFVLEQDYFDQVHHQELHLLPKHNLNSTDVIIWDNKMGVGESNVSLNELKKRNDLKIVASFKRTTNNEKDEFVLFVPKNSLEPPKTSN